MRSFQIILLTLFLSCQLSFGQTKAFISTAELESIAAETFLFDISKDAVFDTSHIKGAIHVTRADISASEGAFHGEIANQKKIEKLLESHQISLDDQLVVYDHKGGCDAARFWLVLKCYGFENVQVYNEGLSDWKNNRLTFKKPTHDNSYSRITLTDKRKEILAFKEDVIASIDQDNAVIVDTRMAEEYSGDLIKSPAIVGGHIPGAVHLDWGNFVDFENNKNVKSIKDIRYNFEQKGVVPEKEIIVYCHTGTRSSHTYMLLKHVLKYPNVKNYDGSWVEWSQDIELSKELGIDNPLRYASYSNIFVSSFFGYMDYVIKQITFNANPWYENYFWFLVMLSLVVWILEIAFPWRKNQAIFRKDFWLDFFFMFFNFYIFNLVIFIAFSKFVTKGIFDITGIDITGISVFDMSDLSWGLQLLIFFLATDFIQWLTHVCLHRFEFLWRFHKVHHSVEEMGFAAHLRYHWMETVFYTPMKFIAVMFIGGFAPQQAFIIYFFTIAVGHLNHANLGWSYGPFKYLLNNPKMHIWHHAKELPDERKHGVNFGITLSLWDYIFRKNYIPSSGRDIPLGFDGMETYPKRFLGLISSGFNRKK